MIRIWTLIFKLAKYGLSSLDHGLMDVEGFRNADPLLGVLGYGF